MPGTELKKLLDREREGMAQCFDIMLDGKMLNEAGTKWVEGMIFTLRNT